MNDAFDVREISIETLDDVVGGKKGDGSTVGDGLAHAIGRIIDKVIDATASAIHMF